MANEFKLSYTVTDINTRLGKIDSLAEKDELPKKLSDLTNDSNFATEEFVERKFSEAELGATFTPYVDADGNLSWSNDKGLENPETVNIRGKSGDDGITPHIGENENWFIGNTDTGKSSRGDKGDKGDAFTFDDFTAEQLDALKGADGKTPTLGVDYWTEKDKQELITEAASLGWIMIDNLTDGWEWKAGYYKNTNGAFTALDGFWTSDSYVSVEPGQVYTVFDYAQIGKDVTAFNSRGIFTDASGNFVAGIGAGGAVAAVGNATSYQVTAPSSAARMYINVWSDTAAGISAKIFLQKHVIMLNPTSTKTVSNVNENLAGKKWVSLGDSITYREKWQPYIYNKYSLIHTNCGIGSTCLGGADSTTLPPFWNANRLAAVKSADPDIVTIMGGANDLAKGVDIGDKNQFGLTLANKDKNTFMGAYSYIIETLLTWKPTLKIVILGTTWAHNDGTDYSEKNTYTDFSNASKTVAEYYGLPFVDLHAKCGFNKFTMEDAPYNIYSEDHIHPNDEGGKIMAAFVDEVIYRLFLF